MSAARPAASAGDAGAARSRKPLRPYNAENRRSSLLTILMWTCGLYFALPLLWLLFSATKSNSDLFASFGFWFGKHFNLWANISTVFTTQSGVYSHWLLNTVAYAGVSAVVASLLATMAGYAFAKYDFPGDKALFSIILGAVMIPLTALAIPTYLLFSGAGLTNTPLAIILPSIVSPFGVFLMRVYAVDAVPDTLLEAGRVDGAGELRMFWQIGFRLLAPGFITVLLFSLVATWNNYFLPLIMLNSTDLYPLTVGLALQQASSSAGGGASVLFSTVITGSLVSVIPLIIAFLYLQRYWQTGLATGGVKG